MIRAPFCFTLPCLFTNSMQDMKQQQQIYLPSTGLLYFTCSGLLCMIQDACIYSTNLTNTCGISMYKLNEWRRRDAPCKKQEVSLAILSRILMRNSNFSHGVSLQKHSELRMIVLVSLIVLLRRLQTYMACVPSSSSGH